MRAKRKNLNHRLLHYSVAVLSVAIAIRLTLLLSPWLYPTVTPLFFVAVLGSAWLGGWEAGLLAALLSTLAVSYFFIQPLYSWQVINVGTIVRLGMFAIATGLISWLNQLRRETFKAAVKREAAMQAEGAQTKQALRQAEEKYRMVLTSMDEGFLIAKVLFDSAGETVDYRCLEVNSAFYMHTGLTRDIVGLTMREIAPDTPIPWLPIYGQVVRSQKAVRFEYDIEMEILRGYYDVHILPLGDPAEHLVAVLFQNITDRKQAEALLRQSETQQTFLLQLNDRLRPLVDPEVIQFEAARLLGEYFGADRVGYAKDQGDGETIVVTRNYTNGVPDIEGRYRYADYGSDLLRELAAGHIVIRPDIAHDPALTDAEKEAHATLQLGATVNVPLLKAGRLIAVLFLHYQEAHPFSEDELALLTAVAERTWDTVERAHAEVALRESEERFRTLFNSIDEGFAIVEVLYDESDKPYDHVIIQANPGFIKHSGLEHPEGKRASDLMPGVEQFWNEFYARVIATNASERAEIYSDIFNRWFDVLISPMSGGSTGRVAITFADVTERKRTEVALRESEEKYRSLFDSMNDGFCILELIYDEQQQPIDYLFLETNATFERQSALSQAVGKTGLYFAPNHETELLAKYYQVAITGEPLEFEITMTDLGRSYRISANRHGDPQKRQLAVVFNDITERKYAEAQVQRAAELDAFRVVLSDALRSLTDPLEIQAEACRLLGERLSVDRAYYVEVNEAENYARVDQNYLRGDSPSLVGTFRLANYGWTVPLLKRGETIIVQDVATSDIIPEAERTTMAAVRIAAHISTPLIKADRLVGALCVTEATPREWLETEIELVHETAERIWAAVERAHVEVERERLLIREQAAREEADRANRVKDEFLAVLSHELRSPLNPILGWAKLLRQGKLDPSKTEQALQTIERNAQLQSELIEDLLDVSRILSGKLSLNIASVNLRTVVQSAMETVRLAAQAKPIQVEADLDSEVGTVSGDATRLQQVVWNLLSNAVKFTPATGHVTVKLESVDNYAQITVRDTGKGITSEFLPHVFDYFQQEDRTTTRKFGGLGLGLAIVRQLVELHGGTVWAESRGEGLGATFTVRLPLTPIQQSSDTAPDSPSDSLDLTGIDVLVVDDEPDSREFIAFVVEQAGANVKTAASGVEAIALLLQSQIDILLSDVGMPEMDGYTLIQKVRGLPPEQNGQVKAIALTAYAGDFNQQKALQAGFQRHIAKPIEPQTLIETISTLLASIILQ